MHQLEQIAHCFLCCSIAFKQLRFPFALDNVSVKLCELSSFDFCFCVVKVLPDCYCVMHYCFVCG